MFFFGTLLVPIYILQLCPYILYFVPNLNTPKNVVTVLTETRKNEVDCGNYPDECTI